jgi:hypothetical protein
VRIGNVLIRRKIGRIFAAEVQFPFEIRHSRQNPPARCRSR